MTVEPVEIEAVFSKATQMIAWRDLKTVRSVGRVGFDRPSAESRGHIFFHVSICRHPTIPLRVMALIGLVL